MAKIYWQTYGEGKQDLVLLHGWGLNAEVWRCVISRLAPHFRLHLVDLPGYGRSHDFDALSLPKMAQVVLEQAPEKAVWLGWSLGGLVASQIGLIAPQQVKRLIMVCSSPCFIERGTWPGINPELLNSFQQQLSKDFTGTVERFLALQTLGTAQAKQDTRTLKQAILDLPIPSMTVMSRGLEILRTTDLRAPMKQLQVPLLRIYGCLDRLVPCKTVQLLDEAWPSTQSYIIDKAAHAPFISHPELFCDTIFHFTAVK